MYIWKKKSKLIQCIQWLIVQVRALNMLARVFVSSTLFLLSTAVISANGATLAKFQKRYISVSEYENHAQDIITEGRTR